MLLVELIALGEFLILCLVVYAIGYGIYRIRRHNRLTKAAEQLRLESKQNLDDAYSKAMQWHENHKR